MNPWRWSRILLTTVGTVAVVLGLAVSLMPFNEFLPNRKSGVPPYPVSCGVPARTSVRRLDPRWKTYAPGLLDNYSGPRTPASNGTMVPVNDFGTPSNPPPSCRPAARHRLLIGSLLLTTGLLLVALSFGRAGRSPDGRVPAPIAAG